MAVLTKEVQIIFNAIDNASEKITRINNSMKGLSTPIDKAMRSLDNFNGVQRKIADQQAFSNALKKQGITITENGRFYDKLNNRFIRFEKVNAALAKGVNVTQGRFAKLRKVMRRFPGEFLSMGFMFAMIGGALMGFTKQALNSLGNVGLAATKMGRKFIMVQAAVRNFFFQLSQSKAVEGLMNQIIDLLNWFDQLPPSTKEIIYWLIVFGGIIATVLSVVSFLALGLKSGLIPLFSSLAGALGLPTSSFGAFASAIAGALPWVFLIAAAIVVLTAIWTTNFNNIQELVSTVIGDIWKTISTVVEHIIGIFQGLWEMLVGIFEGDSEKFKAGLTKFLRNLIAAIAKGLAGIGKLTLEIGAWIIGAVGSLAFNIAGIFWDMMADILEGAKGFGIGLVDMFVDIGVNIAKALAWPLQSVIDSINGFIEWLASLGLDPGFRLPGVDDMIDAVGSFSKGAFRAGLEATIGIFRKAAQSGRDISTGINEGVQGFIDNLPPLEGAFKNIDRFLDSIFGKTKQIQETTKNQADFSPFDLSGLIPTTQADFSPFDLSGLVPKTLPGLTGVGGGTTNNELNVTTNVTTGAIGDEFDFDKMTDKVAEQALDAMRKFGMEKQA
jgi:hypothetical protein